MNYFLVVLKRSFEKTVSDIFGRTLSERLVRIATFSTTIFFAYLWVSTVDEMSDLYSQEKLTALLAVSVSAALFASGLALNFLFLVPFAIWKEQSLLITKLTNAVTPVVDFAIRNEGHPVQFPIGNVIQSGNGLVVNASGYETYLCGYVENSAAFDSEGVQVTLLSLQGGGKALSEPVHLQFRDGEYQDGYARILAGHGRTSMLFRVQNDTLYIAGANDLNVEQADFFTGHTKEFSGRLAVSCSDHGSLWIDFELNLEPSPRISILRKEDGRNSKKLQISALK